MRKSFMMLSAAIASLAAVSCVEENVIDPEGQEGEYVELSASFDEDNTKTALGENFSVVWQQNDQIDVSNGTAPFTIKDFKANSTSANFAGNVNPATKSFAVYPSQEKTIWENETVYVTLPSEQEAVAGSFDPHAALAVGKVIDNKVSFKNVGALLGITVNNPNIQSMKVTSNSNVPMSGEGNVVISDTPTVSSTTVDHVMLTGNIESGKTYYMVVYPGNHTDGFTLEFTDVNGRTASYNSKGNALEIERSSHVIFANITIPENKWKAPVYKLVKGVDELHDGDVIRLGASSIGLVASSIADKKISTTSAIFKDDELKAESALDFVLVQNGEKWKLKSGDQYLKSAKSDLSLDPNGLDWTISIQNDLADISQARGRSISYDKDASTVVFKHYSLSSNPGKYTNVEIYRRDGNGSPVDPKPDEPTIESTKQYVIAVKAAAIDSYTAMTNLDAEPNGRLDFKSLENFAGSGFYDTNDESIIWTVTKYSDNTYSISSADNFLTPGDNGASMSTEMHKLHFTSVSNSGTYYISDPVTNKYLRKNENYGFGFYAEQNKDEIYLIPVKSETTNEPSISVEKTVNVAADAIKYSIPFTVQNISDLSKIKASVSTETNQIGNFNVSVNTAAKTFDLTFAANSEATEKVSKFTVTYENLASIVVTVTQAAKGTSTTKKYTLTILPTNVPGSYGLSNVTLNAVADDDSTLLEVNVSFTDVMNQGNKIQFKSKSGLLEGSIQSGNIISVTPSPSKRNLTITNEATTFTIDNGKGASQLDSITIVIEK